MIGNTSGLRGLLSQNTSVHHNMISSTTPRFVAQTITRSGQIEPGKHRKQYVGETGDHVNQRMNGHRDDWKHKRFERSPVAEHFCSSEHDFLNHATLCCLAITRSRQIEPEKTRENDWIRRLNILRSYGINKGDQLRESSFLSQGM